MLLISLFTAILFTAGGFFIPPLLFSWDPLPAFTLVWHLPGSGVAVPAGAEKQPFNLIVYEDGGKTILLGPQAPSLPVPEGSRVSVPLLGEGYFMYQKLNKEISYHSSTGEELWRKEYRRYPISDYYGNLILLLVGDSSRVDLINRNGTLVGQKSVYGSFLTNYDFAEEFSRAALVFSSGEAYVLEEEGELVFKHDFKTKQGTLFLKSCALSPDGRLLAVHLLEGQEDRILILESNSKKEAEIIHTALLPAVYPHLLYIAVNSYGVLVAAPDQTFFFGLGYGSKDWNEPNICEEECAIYRPVYAGRDFFVFGSGQNWTLVDQRGIRLVRVALASKPAQPWRFLPGGELGLFGLHSGAHLEYYRYKNQH